MSHNIIRKIIQKTGIDIRRYKSETNRLAWLSDLDIQSVFDVGANIGQFAAEIREALPHATIYSFEPLKDCFESLNTSRKHDTAFFSYNSALGEKTGTETIQRSSYAPSSSLLPMADSHKELFPHTAQQIPETIQIRKLDDVFAEIKPKGALLIKVDTQGYEDKVIAGGMNAFRAARVALMETSFVELYKGQPLFGSIYQKMLELGFVYRGALHQKIDKKTGEVIFEDSIFIRLK